MIKNAVKNFFKNIPYVFVPMGIIYLFFLVAFFIFVGNLVQSAGKMFNDLMTLIQGSVEGSTDSVNQFFTYSAEQLTAAWNGNLWDFFRTIFETRWLTNTVVGFFETLNESTEGFAEGIGQIVSEFMNNFRALIAGVLSMCIFGILFASFVTRMILRRRTAKRGVKKFIVAHTVVPVVQAVLLVGCGILFAFIRYYTFIVVPLFLFLAVAISLTSSWLVHRDAGLKWRETVTVGNILRHLAAVGIILLINIAVAVALFFANKLLAILIMLPFILYSLNIADINTDAIVCKLIEDKKREGEPVMGTSVMAEPEGADAASAARENAQEK